MGVKSVRIQLNRPGIIEFLKSQPVHDDLERRARAIADAAGGEAEGFLAEDSVAPDRAALQVITTTHEARAREARDRALTSAIDAGRS